MHTWGSHIAECRSAVQDKASAAWGQLLAAVRVCTGAHPDAQRRGHDGTSRALQAALSACLGTSAKRSLSVWGMRQLLAAWALCQVQSCAKLRCVLLSKRTAARVLA